MKTIKKGFYWAKIDDMKLLKVKVRCVNGNILTYKPDFEMYDGHKEVYLNIDVISHIEDYNGLCCLGFSLGIDDLVLTDIPFESAHLFDK